jgi:cell division protein FtsI (penicillin-binding protein 3)
VIRTLLAHSARLNRLARDVGTARPAAAFDPLRANDGPDAAFEQVWRRTIKRRVLVVLTLVLLSGGAIEARLVQFQVFRHAEFAADARRQQQGQIQLVPDRGDIVDRHGQVLAYSVDAEEIVADPSSIPDPADTVRQLCAALGDCTQSERAELVSRLSGPGQYAMVRQARFVSPQQATRVADLRLHGITLVTQARRFYPNGDLGSQVIGFAGIDNAGLSGIEATYDAVIRGKDGLAVLLRDAHRKLLETRVERAPTTGATLELTLDLYLQYIAERELDAGVKANDAKGGSAIIMDPHTGAILALANYPTFNPNAYWEYPADRLRDRAVQALYEPGSTFKVVTASAALQEGVIKPTDVIDTNPGYISFPGRPPIREAAGHDYGVLSFEDVIVKSSNVGAIKVGLRVGADRLSRYVHRFGFGQALAPDFRGENAGMVWGPADLNDSELASMSMGYHVGVTPLQMVTAVSAVANGGTLFEPHVVRAIVRDGHRDVIQPNALRTAINRDTAATLTQIMEDVVVRGTATAAQLDQYRVAGKTGTTNKLEDGHYSPTDYNASFVGFVPARRPVFTIIVVIDTPRAGHHYGGDVAAPIFKRIAEAALRQYGVPPTVNPVPPVIVASDTSAPAVQPTAAGTSQPVVALAGGRILMPDVRGLGAREALRVLGAVGLSVHVKGAGVVLVQTPGAGAAIDPGGWSMLQLGQPAEDTRLSPGGGPR